MRFAASLWGLALLLAQLGLVLANQVHQQVNDLFGHNGTGSATTHTNNWAVLVCSSRYWFNYRVCPITTDTLSA